MRGTALAGTERGGGVRDGRSAHTAVGPAEADVGRAPASWSRPLFPPDSGRFALGPAVAMWAQSGQHVEEHHSGEHIPASDARMEVLLVHSSRQ